MRTDSFALLVWLALLILPVHLFSDNADNKLIDRIYTETSLYRFRTADSLIKANENRCKSNPTFHLAVINYYWWKLISGQQNAVYAKKITERIELVARNNKVNSQISDHELFVLISIYAFQARVSLKDHAYFSALSALSTYYSIIKQSFGREYRYSPFLLTSGLYQFFSGLARDRYPIFSPLLNQFASGNMKLGLYYLGNASLSDDMKIKQEAEYFLMKIHFDIHHDYKEAEKYCQLLIKKYPDNLLFQYYLFKIWLASGQVAKATDQIEVLERLSKRNPQLTPDEKRYFVDESLKELNKRN